ncbi:endolytic transglycosylase MltG [Deferribacter autotrophicus]|uniref:Endolytic murein transglycosylase n=1 Tax=Deferribacter autotrophicus TaxID=500465 RepID=A0A5A8F2J9_9BACT|nr:endolytic transglycosylase MltG [Deferribacter autotrophicus]KAA0258172.1 endolytic transglycosylase MltG [Deferribacter autotrophicus]
MSKLLKIFIIVIIVSFTLSFIVGLWILKCENFLDNNYISLSLEIYKGESVNETYNKIFKHLNPPPFFKEYLIYTYKFAKNRKFGDYEFKNKSLRKVIYDIKNGNVIKIKITIPEGYNIYEIAKLLEAKDITTYEKFIATAHNTKFINQLTGLKLKTIEGLLYPETYYFSKKQTPENIITTMYKLFKERLPDNFENEVSKHGLTFYEGIILASIVQKETYLEDEYPIVASVFYNRLKRKMKLQSDPTVIYGIFENFNGNLQKKDLHNDNNPYNTYIIKGLPPTPICNPSRKAIKAVIYPATTNYLYFVADKNGKHHFSKTYFEHKKKVYLYQIKKH